MATLTRNQNNSSSENANATNNSLDVVDFIKISHNNNNNNIYKINVSELPATAAARTNEFSDQSQQQQVPAKSTIVEENATATTLTASNSNKQKKQQNSNNKNNRKSDATVAERQKERSRSLFSFSKKLSHIKPDKSVKPTPLELSKSSPLLLTAVPGLPIGTPPRQHKFVKSSSIARLLGNTYNAKKFEKGAQKHQMTEGKFNTYHGRQRNGPYLERFKRFSKEDGDISSEHDDARTTRTTTETATGTATSLDKSIYANAGSRYGNLDTPESSRHKQAQQLQQQQDLGSKAMRTLTRSLGKLWWKRTHSVNISNPDPEFKVSYLGNVLTGWAKGEGCVEKQLNTLWRNYTQNNKPDIYMRIKVSASGLKATTRQHGLTEYWANRITYCCAPKNYPRVFCWIYRHEGRKLKHELRCHVVLCGKEKIAHDICETLKENLESALREFKREKILKQNARLSLANAAYDNPSLPRRKIMLSVGGNNYRPPLERSKSAPKLMAIEEAIGEEEGDEVEETNEPEMRSCCQKDSLYPAMTLGRRRCRRGHSIRRTGKVGVTFSQNSNTNTRCCTAQLHQQQQQLDTKAKFSETTTVAETKPTATTSATEAAIANTAASDFSDSDEFEKLLKYNNYDANTSLSNELLPYFDMQLHKNTSQSLVSLSELKAVTEVVVIDNDGNDDNGDDDDEVESESIGLLLPTINTDPSADPVGDYEFNQQMNETQTATLRRNGVCSDGEEDYLDDADDMYFRQAAILNMLHRNSMRKMANLSLSSDESSSIETNAFSSSQLQYRHQAQSSISSNSSSASIPINTINASVQDATVMEQRKQLNTDSDEGSISSGCETSSTVTTNQDDSSLNYRQMQPQQLQQHQQLHCHQTAKLGFERLNRPNEVISHKDNNDMMNVENELMAVYQKLARRHNSDATTYSSSSSMTLKLDDTSPTTSVDHLNAVSVAAVAAVSKNVAVDKHNRKQSTSAVENSDSDSECSDESGYVEFQEQHKSLINSSDSNNNNSNVSGAINKPQPPPKPLPRRFLNGTTI